MSTVEVFVAGVVFHVHRRPGASASAVKLTPWRARWAKTCHGDVLSKIASTWDPSLALLLLEENPFLEKKHLRLLAAIEHGQVRAALVSHDKCPKSVLTDSAKYGGENVRACIAERSGLPEDVQMLLACDGSPMVRAALAGNPSVTEKSRVVAALRA